MALSPDELKKQVALLNQQAALQAKISSDYGSYLEAVKDYKKTYEEIVRNRKLENELNQKALALEVKKQNSANGLSVVEELQLQKTKEQLQILKSQTEEMVTQGKLLKNAIKDTNVMTLSSAKLAASLTKGLGNLPGMVTKGIGRLKDLGLLDMEKSIKMSGLQMGILSKQSVNFRENIKDAAGQTTFIGAGIEDLAKMQSDYSDQIGRGVQLSKESLVAMGQMSKETGLSSEGTAKLVADMDELGVSASKVGDYVNQTMNDTHKMGLNSSKVVKNIQENMKMLNQYNFKGGIKGLEKMAETAAKLGVKMDFVSGMADKAFDIEGAVDMSAQLQVMGGAWAKLADPFHLMYMARNDTKGLAEEMAKAAEASMHFAEDGSIQMGTVEMARLKNIAKDANVNFDELVTSGKKLLALNKIKSQINFSLTPEAQEYIAATAEFGKDGKATIMVGADKSIKKFVKDLSADDIRQLADRQQEKAAAGERAKQAMNFDEALKNTFDKMKISLLPIVEVLNKELMPKFDKFIKRWDSGKWGEKIEVFATKIGELISYFAGWVIDNPIKTAFAIGGAKFIGFFMEKANWISNGLALSTGFNMGVKAEGGFLNMLKGALGMGGEAGAGGGALSTIAKAIGPLSGIVGGVGIGGAVSEATGQKSTTTGTVMGGLAGAGGWAAAAALAPETFGASFLIPLIAGAAGKYFGDMASQPAAGAPQQDAYFPKPKTNGFSKGRQIIQDGVAHPINNYDKELFIGKPGGAIDKSKGNTNANIPATINHTFQPITINGSIMVNTPGNPGKGIELLKDAQFIRDMTSLIHIETKRQLNQKQ